MDGFVERVAHVLVLLFGEDYDEAFDEGGEVAGGHSASVEEEEVSEDALQFAVGHEGHCAVGAPDAVDARGFEELHAEDESEDCEEHVVEQLVDGAAHGARGAPLVFGFEVRVALAVCLVASYGGLSPAVAEVGDDEEYEQEEGIARLPEHVHDFLAHEEEAEAPCAC